VLSVRRVAAIGAALGVAGALAAGCSSAPPVPACTVTSTPGAPSDSSTVYTLSPDQANNAATIAAVGLRMGMPDRAVTVALATAMQESKLTNLDGGDRDSAGLFQQRPSQGWGTYDQVIDTVYSSTTFYDHLRAERGWTGVSINEAAQRVQHSGVPDAYGKWESEARAAATALTGETPTALSCQNLTIGAPTVSLSATAAKELGTTAVSGSHPVTRGWALASWLVAHAEQFGVDNVTFDGRTWTPASGSWAVTGPSNGKLTLHQVSGK
jgi:hypothetical protein